MLEERDPAVDDRRSLGGTEFPAQVTDQSSSGIEEDICFPSTGAKQERREGTRLAMSLEQGFQRHVGEDVAVVDKEGSITESWAGIANAATGVEQERFMESRQASSTVLGVKTEFLGEGAG